MASVTSNIRSSINDVSALLEDNRWSSPFLTYSFPTAGAQYDGYRAGEEPFDGFRAFASFQKEAVRDILANYSAVSNLTFSERSGGAGVLRFGMTDGTDTAHAYTPDVGAWGGDSWYSNSISQFQVLGRGGYGYHAITHEIGHAVGLKHPHETHKFGAVSKSHDWMAYTVMSYRSYEAQSLREGGYDNETLGYAQSLMMYDIAALQHMYGARFDAIPSDSVYRWDPATGEMSIDGVAQGKPAANRIFSTLWDGGGKDLYDLSAYTTELAIDLRPGEWSSFAFAQRVSLGAGGKAPGNVANALLFQGDTRSLIEDVQGGSAADVVVGNQADNMLDGGGGADRLEGLGGNDVYRIDIAADVVVERAGGGIDTVRAAVDHRLAAQVENLELGSGVVRGAGNGLSNRIVGNGLANILDGAAGADTMIGGAGNDGYYVDNQLDAVLELAGGGVDRVFSLVSYTLGAGVEHLQLGGGLAINATGNALSNNLTGNAAANRIDGGAGGDLMLGGGGDDIYIVDDLRDGAFEAAGAGIDQVFSAVNFTISAEVEHLVLTGSASRAGRGNAKANVLIGNEATNWLGGGDGADRLEGRYGNDFMDGGAGRDLFVFNTPLHRSENVDTLLHFNGAEDVLLLDQRAFTALAPGALDGDAFVRGSKALDAEDRILFDQPSGDIFYDADGIGGIAPVLFARVEDGVQVTFYNFTII